MIVINLLLSSIHQYKDTHLSCNIQQRMAYGAIVAGGGMMQYHSTGGATGMFHQLLPESLEQTLADLPSDAIQFSELPGK